MTGEKGKGGMATEGTGANAARDLGQTWKVSPSVRIEPKQVFTIAEIQGPGAIQHIWMTPTGNWRFSILRIYWDGEREPSWKFPSAISSPRVGEGTAQISSLAVCVNPGSGFNSYWEMPFRKSARITMENIDTEPHDAVLPGRLHAHGGSRTTPATSTPNSGAPTRCLTKPIT